MSSLLNNTDDAIIIINSNGGIESFNKATENIFGNTPVKIVRNNISILIPLLFNENYNKYLKKYANTNISTNLNGEELYGIYNDDIKFKIYINLKYIEISDHKLFICIIHDLSEKKLIKQKILATKIRDKKLANTETAFNINMSHEIRTPLNAIFGFAELLLEDKNISYNNKKNIKKILKSCESLLDITNDFLDSSKLNNGMLKLENICFHLPNALEGSLDIVEHQAINKNLTIELKYDNRLPKKVLGDPVRLRQVILNLFSNAIKFTKEGIITLIVKPGNKIGMFSFAITDSGIGMTKEQISIIFNSYTQADKSTSRHFGGIGLGTTISKQIIELMRGKIWVKSEIGRGSTFYFEIFMNQASPEQAQECLYDYSIEHSSYFSPRLFNILFIKNIKENAILLMLRLEKLGHKVNLIENNEDTIELFKKSKYDLVLIDIQVPELNDFNIVQEIKKLEKNTQNHTNIIAFTTNILEKNYNNYYDNKIDNIIIKPINFSKLINLMESTVNSNLGIENNINTLKSYLHSNFNFSPIEGLINYENALNLWQDTEVYLKALQNFSEYKIKGINNDEKLDYATIHTLKDLAGSLGMENILLLTTSIENDLVHKNIKEADIKTTQLKQNLIYIITAIKKLNINNNYTKANRKLIKNITQELSLALEELNPDSVDPVLYKLNNFISEAELLPIQNEVDAFNFDEAQSLLKNLVNTLDI